MRPLGPPRKKCPPNIDKRVAQHTSSTCTWNYGHPRPDGSENSATPQNGRNKRRERRASQANIPGSWIFGVSFFHKKNSFHTWFLDLWCLCFTKTHVFLHVSCLKPGLQRPPKIANLGQGPRKKVLLPGPREKNKIKNSAIAPSNVRN